MDTNMCCIKFYKTWHLIKLTNCFGMHSPKIMLIHIAEIIISIVPKCEALCTDCYVTRLTSFDDLLVTEDQLWARISPNQGVCYFHCKDDDICVSFHFNNVNKVCIGYAVAFTSPTPTTTSNNDGNGLYLTCKADHHYGWACSQATDCNPQNTDCLDGICDCQFGYRYSNITRSCVQYYFGCYEDREEDRLFPYEATVSGSGILTNSMCRGICRDLGYQFSGTQYSDSCYCADSIKTGFAKYQETKCNYPCTGDSSDKCGGFYAMSVYNATQM